VISTVDPQARHGHKTTYRGFDGCKGHIAVDPDSEIITARQVSAGNTGDAGPAPDLISDLTSRPPAIPTPNPVVTRRSTVTPVTAPVKSSSTYIPPGSTPRPKSSPRSHLAESSPRTGLP
jgi:hypothetical protein